MRTCDAGGGASTHFGGLLAYDRVPAFGSTEARVLAMGSPAGERAWWAGSLD